MKRKCWITIKNDNTLIFIFVKLILRQYQLQGVLYWKLLMKFPKK